MRTKIRFGSPARTSRARVAWKLWAVAAVAGVVTAVGAGVTHDGSSVPGVHVLAGPSAEGPGDSAEGPNP